LVVAVVLAFLAVPAAAQGATKEVVGHLNPELLELWQDGFLSPQAARMKAARLPGGR
jgi:hypothetical protein